MYSTATAGTGQLWEVLTQEWPDIKYPGLPLGQHVPLGLGPKFFFGTGWMKTRT